MAITTTPYVAPARQASPVRISRRLGGRKKIELFVEIQKWFEGCLWAHVVLGCAVVLVVLGLLWAFGHPDEVQRWIETNITWFV